MTQEKALQGSTELYKRPKHGEFCWVELASNNIEACKPFYTELFGWHISTSTSVPSINYTEFGVNEKVRSGGMFQMNEQWHDASNKKFDSHWGIYIAVDDVDAVAAKVENLGGKVCVPPTDIPNTGRFCVINDPSGATISMITLSD